MAMISTMEEYQERWGKGMVMQHEAIFMCLCNWGYCWGYSKLFRI